MLYVDMARRNQGYVKCPVKARGAEAPDEPGGKAELSHHATATSRPSVDIGREKQIIGQMYAWRDPGS